MSPEIGLSMPEETGETRPIIGAEAATPADRFTGLPQRPELKAVLAKDKSVREAAMIEDLLSAISKDMAAYGMEQVKQRIAAGNVSLLMVSENLIRKSRQKAEFYEIDKMMKDAEALNANARIISTEDAKAKLDGLSGIACLLRWKEYG